MEPRTLQNPTKAIKGRKKPKQIGNQKHGLHTPKNQLRVSKLKFEPKALYLSKDDNKLLYALNIAHNNDFNPNKQIEIESLSTELIKNLQSVIDFDMENCFINSTLNSFIIPQLLEFDFYIMDLEPVFKLKHKSPILFDAFLALINFLKFPIVEKGETYYFDTAYLKEFDSKLENEYRKIAKKIREIETAQDINTSLEKLRNYMPKSELYSELKSFLLQSFSNSYSELINGYPFSYFSEDKEEKIDIFHRCIFIYSTQSKLYSSIIENGIQELYDNFELHQPCSTITPNKITDLKQDINHFENFVLQFNFLTQKIK